MKGGIILKEADQYQSNLLNEIRNFRDQARPQDDKKKKKKLFWKTCIIFSRLEK